MLALLLAATASLCLLQSVQAQANYASCAGDLCDGQSSTASGNDGVPHCCPTGGWISGQVNNNIYCSEPQDCSKFHGTVARRRAGFRTPGTPVAPQKEAGWRYTHHSQRSRNANGTCL